MVESVELAPDLKGVVCHARMVPGADAWLHDKTQFWVVKPRISGGQVSGLETLLAGSYIGMDPVLEGTKTRAFAGLEVAPIVTMTEAGRYYVLRSERAGGIDVGTPIYFQHIAVGKVVSSAARSERRLRDHARVGRRAVRKARARQHPLLERERHRHEGLGARV